jgi:hypothetical protein
MVDMALASAFLAVHILYKFRNHLEPKTPPGVDVVADADAPEGRLMAEWFEARRRRSALQSELDHPSISRVHSSQVKLIQATRVAGAKCHRVLVELRASRKGRSKSR